MIANEGDEGLPRVDVLGAHGRMAPVTIALVGRAIAERHPVTRCVCGGPCLNSKHTKASWCPGCGRRENLPEHWTEIAADVRRRAADGRATPEDIDVIIAARKAAGIKRVSLRRCGTCNEQRMTGLSMSTRHCRGCSNLSPRERRWKREAADRQRAERQAARS